MFPRIARRAKREFGQSYASTILRPKRRFHAFGVGAPKSGTTSLSNLFALNYRAAHEPDLGRVLSTIISHTQGRSSELDLRRFIVKHDRLEWLELNSSCMNYYFVRPLTEEFPEAKFILTLRDCYSFANSMIDDQMNTPRPEGHLWPRMHDIFFGADQFAHADEERILAQYGLHTLAGYFSYWARHNVAILDTVPAERLLIVKTSDISVSLGKIAAFLDIPVGTLDTGRMRGGATVEKHGLLKKIDPAFVEQTANRYCGDLMTRFFPEVSWPC